MFLYRSDGIDNDVVVNMSLVRKLEEGYLSATKEGCHTIKITWSNGNVEHLRFESKKLRDDGLLRMSGGI
jgi:hypothetical protein